MLGVQAGGVGGASFSIVQFPEIKEQLTKHVGCCRFVVSDILDIQSSGEGVQFNMDLS